LLPTRSALLELIARLPGIRFLELRRQTGLANGVLAYHLGILEKESLLRSERGPGYAEFYPVAFNKLDIHWFAIIRHDRSRELLSHLLESGRATHGELATTLRIAPSTASWYLNRLLKAGLVRATFAGRQTWYELNEPDRIRRLLSVYASTWEDTMVDRFASMWENNSFKVKRKK
jgi:predicted transcriptional regulator